MHTHTVISYYNRSGVQMNLLNERDIVWLLALHVAIITTLLLTITPINATPTDYSHAYLTLQDNKLIDAKGVKDLTIYGTITSSTDSFNTTWFKANNGYAYHPTPWLNYNEMNQSWTIALHVKMKWVSQYVQPWFLSNAVQGTTGGQIFLCKDDDASSNYSFIGGVFADGSETELFNASYQPTNDDTSLIITHNTDDLIFYINGVEAKRERFNFPISSDQCTGSTLFAVMCGNPTPNAVALFDGELSQIYIYKRALNIDEIKNLSYIPEYNHTLQINVTNETNTTTQTVTPTHTTTTKPKKTKSKSSGGSTSYNQLGIAKTYLLAQLQEKETTVNYYCIKLNKKTYCANTNKTELYELRNQQLWRLQ